MRKRLVLLILPICLAVPLALSLAARTPATTAQRDDRDHRDVLVITKAIYGAGKKHHDITAPLNAEIHDAHLRLPVRNDTMGGDPAKDKPKTLSVWYTFNGRPYSVTLNENDILDLPGPEAFERR